MARRSSSRAAAAPPSPAPALQPSLHERVVLVTGGAQGIGRGVAQAVLAAGGRVLIGDTDSEAGRACLDEWQVGDAAAFLPLDVASEAGVRRWIAAAGKRFGRIDGLVNNAGIADPHTGPLEQLTLREWRRRLAVNLDGAFLCAKHALPWLRQAPEGGVLLNIASSRALQSEPDTEAYAASKGALLAFTHALAISAGPAVRVNAISPGWISTEAWRKPAERRPPRLSAADHAQHPAGRVGTPADVGALAAFLLSPQAGFITGENFVVDGGMVRKMQYV
ncbi:glucose 1-dehydrogenase [Dyella sp.]|jgi:NAD(P)-dependent dehydrogenase (short-subunit alcohol dehydrogenase family)|uniref:glucose 1-dehydrogenase n=1 Tax=Dyella sp. TaxID=1869338 RepID=UPI002D77B9D8|nr:glucose 1-dehydrogenase [Dyella sp.]HET6432507.1 glucose 1-dehydrogenase [Dyella sp.]